MHGTTTINHSRRRNARTLLAAGLAVCALPASASAATVAVERDGTLRYFGSSGISMLRRASRITRKGKTISARLALRLDRSLAGRLLRVEVDAVDVRGSRQLQP
jgi:hypothetical protein